MPYQKVTPIEDLVPDIDSVDDSSSNPRNNIMTPTQTKLSRRFIRNNPRMMPESGMVNSPYEHEQVVYNTDEENALPPAAQNNIFRNSPIIEFPPAQPQHTYQLTCQDVFYHIESCPLCKKFYKQDNTIYLVIIAILVLACALLLKKVLSD